MGYDHDKRVIVYPNYIDSKKTVAEGRRIPRDKACESPHVTEIADSCNRALGCPAEIEVPLQLLHVDGELSLAITFGVIRDYVSCCFSPRPKVMGISLALAGTAAKYYSRDFLVPGRVRVQLFKPDGKPTNPAIPNRRTLFLRIAQLVPKHLGRSEKAKAQAAKAAAAQTATSSSSKAGKKGKKGRK